MPSSSNPGRVQPLRKAPRNAAATFPAATLALQLPPAGRSSCQAAGLPRQRRPVKQSLYPESCGTGLQSSLGTRPAPQPRLQPCARRTH